MRKPRARLVPGDCRHVLARMAARGSLVDAVVTDPPYHLNFMGKAWDSGSVAFQVETWAAVFAVMKPGAYLLAFGGSRSSHRMVCAIEDAGFEIRDTVMWLYGQGFPKSLDVSKAIDKAAGAARKVIGPPPYTRGRATQSYSETRRVSHDYPPQPITAPTTDEAAQWSGWGTALKPAHEPIILARKPLIGTVAANVLAHGVGAMNIDACRIAHAGKAGSWGEGRSDGSCWRPGRTNGGAKPEGAFNASGRWPANVIHDGSDEVEATFAAFGESFSRSGGRSTGRNFGQEADDSFTKDRARTGHTDAGSPSRFFYCAKASAKDRGDSKHATIKPQALMRYLCRLVTPPGGTVLDPFCGSGSTLQAARAEGFHSIGIEKDKVSQEDTRKRLAA